MFKLILASQSPRRHELLQKAGYEFHTDTLKVSEIIDKNLNIDTAIMALAQFKAQSYYNQHNYLKGLNNLILTADTVVVFQNRIFGKPESEAEAHQFLQLLSGQTHSVKTAICLYPTNGPTPSVAIDTTLVTFKKLSPQEITEYVKTSEPMDKAGAYAIQGQAQKFIAETQGSISNVIGLPLELLEKVLKENGWNVARK